MIIAMPVLEDNGKRSRIGIHFGRSPLFAVCDTDKNDVKIVSIGMHGEGCTPVEGLMRYKPDMVYVRDIGNKAMIMLTQRNIEIKTGRFATVGEVLENLESLRKIRKGCGH